SNRSARLLSKSAASRFVDTDPRQPPALDTLLLGPGSRRPPGALAGTSASPSSFESLGSGCNLRLRAFGCPLAPAPLFAWRCLLFVRGAHRRRRFPLADPVALPLRLLDKRLLWDVAVPGPRWSSPTDRKPIRVTIRVANSLEPVTTRTGALDLFGRSAVTGSIHLVARVIRPAGWHGHAW